MFLDFFGPANKIFLSFKGVYQIIIFCENYENKFLDKRTSSQFLVTFTRI
jgi:hypothetical protein